MARDTLTERVERLEIVVEELKTLPAEVRSMGARLDVMDGRLTSVEGRLSSVELQVLQLRREMHDGFLALKTELSEQIETNWQRTRALFEEVIGRIKAISER